MAKVTIGERTYDLPRYKLRELELAAPYLDALRAAGQPTTVQDVIRSARHVMGVVAAGIARSDPRVTEQKKDAEEVVKELIEELVDAASFEDLTNMRNMIPTIQREAGMVKAGEMKEGSVPATTSGQGNSDQPSVESGGSSQSSSQPDAPEAPGTQSPESGI